MIKKHFLIKKIELTSMLYTYKIFEKQIIFENLLIILVCTIYLE